MVFPNSIIGPVLEAKLWGRTRDTSRAKEASREVVWLMVGCRIRVLGVWKRPRVGQVGYKLKCRAPVTRRSQSKYVLFS